MSTTVSRPLMRSWDAFDRLFEEAFAPVAQLHHSHTPSHSHSHSHSLSRSLPPMQSFPAMKSPPPPTPQTERNHHRRTSYSTFTATPFVNGPVEPEISDADEDFKELWDEAARRRRKLSTRTVTRRRTLQHAAMPTPQTAVAPPLRSRDRDRDGDENAAKAEHRKSKFHLYHPPGSDQVTATFELPDVRKEDVHVAFQQDRLTITYFSVSTTETQNSGRTLLRERKERKYARTLPLPAGVQFDDIKAFLEDGRLTVSYPRTPVHRRPLAAIAASSAD